MKNIISYTKEELAYIFKLNAERNGSVRTDVLTRKLKSLGYKFSTRGRGDSYRIDIEGGLPAADIATFAKENFNISSNIEKLSHFLYLIFSFNDSTFVNIPPNSLQWITYACNDTLQKWIDALVNVGLLIVDEFTTTYYATKKRQIAETINDNTADYEYTRDFKIISKEDYKKAMKAYDFAMQDMKGIEENPELARGEVYYYSALRKLEALDGWWAMKAERGIFINTEWHKYNELISLLSHYNFEKYEKREKGNLLKELEERQMRELQWAKEREEKRLKLKEIQLKKEEEELTQKLKKNKIKDFSTMPVFEDVGEALLYLQENYVSKGGLTQ